MRLIFVYNADGGAMNAIIDAAHKLMFRSTYPCSLCAVTYGAASMRREWKEHLRSLPYETRFYHRDGFVREWPQLDLPLPVVMIQSGDETPTVLLSKADLDRQSGVGQLISTLATALSRAGHSSG